MKGKAASQSEGTCWVGNTLLGRSSVRPGIYASAFLACYAPSGTVSFVESTRVATEEQVCLTGELNMHFLSALMERTPS